MSRPKLPPMKKPCEVCGDIMSGLPCLISKKKTCSSECAHQAHKAELVTRPCEVCGVVMSGLPSKMRTKTVCSYVCAGKQREKHESKLCLECGVEITGSPSALKHKSVCDGCKTKPKPTKPPKLPKPKKVHVPSKARESKRVTKSCVVCGAQMSGPPSIMNAQRKTCSVACLTKLRHSESYRDTECVVCKSIMRQPVGKKNITCGPQCLAKYRARNHAQTSNAIKKRKELAHTFKGDRKKIAAELMKAQNGACASCGKVAQYGGGMSGLVLDHCHKTGVARGLLCSRCNSSFGLLDDSPEKIRGLLKYAESFKQLRLVAS